MFPGTDEVLKLAPDAGSIKAAQGLLLPAHWVRAEFDDQAVWGECRGSGSTPYQVQVDREGPAFRCSCPSRKFPCKHGLALLLRLAQQPDAFTRASAPPWVSAWLQSRRQRAERRENTAKPAASAEEKGPAAEAGSEPASGRRDALRQQRWQAGLDELERWLNDGIRHGLARLSAQATACDEIAVRMVDAQLPGLAFRLRHLGRLLGDGDFQPARALGQMGQLRLLIDASRRLDELPAAVQADLHYALGSPPSRESVFAAGERLADDWLVVGQSCRLQDRLWERRVWLLGGRSGRWAMWLDHAHGSRDFGAAVTTGSCWRGALAFYPGNSPLRAARVEGAADGMPMPWSSPLPFLDTALDRLSTALAANPWQLPQSLLIGDGVPVLDARGWTLSCRGRHRLRLDIAVEAGWPLLAESGGEPLPLFGEWSGESLRPLSAWRFSPPLCRVWVNE
ncbi:MAG TPA: SWIM zinc finger domain-containing protein [Accumulibacter sp.]|mgnify:FL=1|nr:SWIM zinc finger domain-containing protein [Accumulibacter sp.]